MRLSSGARLALFCPSGPTEPSYVKRSCNLLRQWGYEPVNAPERPRRLFLAASDEERLEDLTWALSADGFEAAWVVRGGYGLGRLLPRIDYESLKARPVLGFSDVTALLWALFRRGWKEAVHGPNVQGLEPYADEPTHEALQALLRGDPPKPLRGRALVAGAAQGPLVGGNACVLASLCGTSEQLVARDCLLFLEEVHEEPYRLDRILTQLINSGSLAGVRGIVLGEFYQCGSARAVWSVLRERLSHLGVPVLAGIPMGHGSANLPFIYGAEASLEGNWLCWASSSTR